jgi:1-acyl-sn-glycerol-3-phosphate acyltransferase
VLFPIVRYFARATVEGREHLAGLEGPVVLVSNHTSHLDCPVILSALPRGLRRRTLVAAAADYFWKVKALGAVTSLALGTVPFKRRDGSRQSIERLKEALRRGWSVLIFPEGGRSHTGELRPFKHGAAYVCLDTHSAAVPIYVEGAHRLMPKGSSIPKQGEVLLRFGPPVKPRPGDDYASLTARMEDAILGLSGTRQSRAG